MSGGGRTLKQPKRTGEKMVNLGAEWLRGLEGIDETFYSLRSD